MNGSENGYAGALFFALISFGALLKIDDVIGWSVGAVSALLAAISLRRALVKSAQSIEEDHQRMEIQFQQLRNKVIETSAANLTAMTSINDTSQVVQENLRAIYVRLKELEKLNTLAKNSAATYDELKKFSVEVKSKSDSSEILDELKKISALEEENKANLQTVLKLLQIVGQMMKSSPYAKELKKISASLEKIAEHSAVESVEISAPPPEEIPSSEGMTDNRQDLSLRKKIAAKIKRK
ncbi:MAG: hypothetical protein IJS69_03565 [Selenomonadaceae bacterium]|nr:hypothetical protein [Selenomonadaceae bacterium]